MVTEKILSNLKTIRSEIPKWGEEAVLKKSGEIVDLLKYGQLAKGIDSLGKKMQLGRGYTGYSPNTQAYASAQGISVPKTEGYPYNFQWTGDTFDSMGLKKGKEFEYEIFTIDGKQKKLERIYGNIFDLTKEHNDWINKNIIEPYISEKISEKLLNF